MTLQEAINAKEVELVRAEQHPAVMQWHRLNGELTKLVEVANLLDAAEVKAAKATAPKKPREMRRGSLPWLIRDALKTSLNGAHSIELASSLGLRRQAIERALSRYKDTVFVQDAQGRWSVATLLPSTNTHDQSAIPSEEGVQ